MVSGMCQLVSGRRQMVSGNINGIRKGSDGLRKVVDGLGKFSDGLRKMKRTCLFRLLFCEIRFRTKTIVCIDNLFLNPDLR